MDAKNSTATGTSVETIREVQTRYTESKIAERFKLTGELRLPKKGEWYWWTGRHGPAACLAHDDRPFNAPILVEIVQHLTAAQEGMTK